MTEQIPSGEEGAKGPIFQILCRGASGRSKSIPAFVEVVQCATGTYQRHSQSHVLCPRLTSVELHGTYGVGCHEGNPLPDGYDYDALDKLVGKMRACPYFIPLKDPHTVFVHGPVIYSAWLPCREPQEPKPEKQPQPPKPRLYKTPFADGIVSALFPTYYQICLHEMKDQIKT